MPPFGELGEQQGPIACFDHLIENFFQPLQLGRAAQEAIVHRPFAQGEGGMVADLFQPGE